MAQAPWAEQLNAKVVQDCLVALSKNRIKELSGAGWGGGMRTHLQLVVGDIDCDLVFGTTGWSSYLPDWPWN